MTEFKEACISGDIKLAKQLYKNNNVDIKILNEIFYETIYKKKTREYIVSLKKIKLNYNKMKKILFFDFVKHKGKLVEWLLDSKKITISKCVNNEIMFVGGFFNRFDICRELKSRGVKYTKCELINAFFFNDFEMIQQIYPYIDDVSDILFDCLQFAFYHGNIELIKWIKLLNPDLEVPIKFIFEYLSIHFSQRDRIKSLNRHKKLNKLYKCSKFTKNEICWHKRCNKRICLPKVESLNKHKLEDSEILEFLSWFYSFFDLQITIDYEIGSYLLYYDCDKTIRWLIEKKYECFFFILPIPVGYVKCEGAYLYGIQQIYKKNRDMFNNHVVEHLQYIDNFTIHKWHFDTTLNIDILVHILEESDFEIDMIKRCLKNSEFATRFDYENSLKTLLWAREQINMLDYEIENFDKINKELNTILRQEKRRYIGGLEIIDRLLKHEIMYDQLIFTKEMMSYLCH